MAANDDLVAATVRAVTSGGAELCEEFRHGLGSSAADTLRLFSMRRTMQARRQASLGLLNEAMDGFALLPGLNDVPWESWFKAALFLIRYLGGDLLQTGHRFADVAESAATHRADVATESMDRVDTLLQCQLVEVSTNYGTGLVELLVFRNTPTIGLFGARSSVGVNHVGYDPSTNLAQLAASLADALDATRALVTGPIGQDQLAATSFSLIVPGSYVPTAGCLGFTADGAEGGSFSVYVAELPEDVDVGALGAAANDNVGHAAVVDSRRLILFCAQPNFDEVTDVEDDVDFHDVQRLAHAALLDPATAAWKPR
ncbi:MAG: hypothetical protein ACYDB2_06660 [Acidimicrobiales bacterium]